MPQKANNVTKGYKTTKGQQDHKRSTTQPHNRLGFQGTQEKQAHKLELAESSRRTQTYAPNARASPSLPNSNKATKGIGGIKEEEHKSRTQTYAPNARASPSLPNSNKATTAIGGIREEEHKRRTQTYAPNAKASPSLPNSNKATKSIGGIREKEHKRRTQNSPRSRSQ